LAFEEVVVVWGKEPLKVLERGRRLREIEKAERVEIIIYLPSPSEPLIICQTTSVQCIIWDYRNMKPLINTLEGDPVMKKLVNGGILRVAINSKGFAWNDVKNKTMRNLMEGKLGTVIRLKLELSGNVEEIRGEREGGMMAADLQALNGVAVSNKLPLMNSHKPSG
jgi:hypothetical protein